MRGRTRSRRRLPPENPDIERALEAMTAPELRAAVRAVLGELDEEARASAIDALVARAAKGTSGWRPSRPSQRMVEEATSFAQAARQLGYADPADVTGHRAMKAFLSGLARPFDDSELRS